MPNNYDLAAHYRLEITSYSNRPTQLAIRPICASINSPTNNLAWFAANTLAKAYNKTYNIADSEM